MKFHNYYLLLTLVAMPCMANMEYDGSVSAGTNDNVSNAVSDNDIFNDQFYAVDFNAGKLWVPQTGRSLLWRAHTGVQRFQDSEGLDNVRLGTSLSYIHRLGLGAYAPRLTVSARADYRDFETDLRDGWLYQVNTSIQKRFTPSMHANISISHEKRTADREKAIAYTAFATGDVFNQTNNEIKASLDYVLENNSMLTIGYRYRHGEIDASTNPGSEFFSVSKAIAQDNALCNFCWNYVAYLVNASSHSIMLDWNWPLGRDMSASANLERRVADTDGDNTYTTNIVSVKLTRRF
jgi:hypothetical protein